MDISYHYRTFQCSGGRASLPRTEIKNILGGSRISYFCFLKVNGISGKDIMITHDIILYFNSNLFFRKRIMILVDTFAVRIIADHTGGIVLFHR
jgi:hypothetical protein